MKLYIKILSVFVLLSYLSLSSYLPISLSPALAAIPGEGLTISPPVREITVEPGKKVSETIKITNPTSSLIEVYPSVLNFNAKGEEGDPSFYPADEEGAKFALANWIEFSQKKLALTPEQVIEFNYQIVVPEEAEPGGHYGVVFFSTEPPKPGGETSQVSISSMIGSLILVKVPGTIIEKGIIENFSTRKLWFKTPVEFNIKLLNVGNIHFKPKGEISIKNIGGGEIAGVEVNKKEGNVLPDSTRRFSESWNPGVKSFYKIPFGRFSANLEIKYGESEKNAVSQISFWIIPYWIVIAAAAILLLIILLIIIIKIKRSRRRKTKPSYFKFEREDET